MSDNIIRLAHISDLHFGERSGPKKEDEIWDRLVRYFHNTLKPDLILVTGDIANTPDRNLFKRAKEKLEFLSVHSTDTKKHLVCPGNHDRFVRGINWCRKEYYTRGSDALFFEKEFRDVMLTPGNPYTTTFRKSSNEWRCRFLGCDTSENETFFAQGFANGGTIDLLNQEAIKEDSNAKNIDLVFLLVHHHPLPIPGLEGTKSDDPLSLLNLTGLLNSGTLLNALAASHVNMVLHGHEHYRNIARFGTFSGLQGQVVVAAAGSATGTKTLEGWDEKRINFNLIELHPDRSVKLKQIGYDVNIGQIYNHNNVASVTLLSSEEVRRANFLRRCSRDINSSKDSPRSRITKVFDFMDNRDILITETRTECSVFNPWTIYTSNQSGAPTDAYIAIDPYQGRRIEKTSIFQRIKTPDGKKTYIASFDGIARNNLSFGARCLTMQWKWNGGAVFSTEEIHSIPDPGEFRNDDREFVVAEAYKDLEELNITVRLPEHFAPDINDVQVFTRLVDKEAKPHESLNKHIQSYGNGTLHLRIPYPYKGYEYILTWPVVEKLQFDDKDNELSNNIRNNHEQILEDVSNILDAWKIPTDSHTALYLPVNNTKQKKVLERISYRHASPEKLSLEDTDSLTRAAWWGGVRIWSPDESDSEMTFIHGERFIALVPIGFSRIRGGSAAALLRLGLLNPIPDIDSDENEQCQALKFILDHISALVLERCRKP